MNGGSGGRGAFSEAGMATGPRISDVLRGVARTGRDLPRDHWTKGFEVGAACGFYARLERGRLFNCGARHNAKVTGTLRRGAARCRLSNGTSRRLAATCPSRPFC